MPGESLAGDAILLVVRFAALPDIVLSVNANITTALALKVLIRHQLPQSYMNSRLRLIFAGKILDDGTPLTQSMGLSRQTCPSLVPAATSHGQHSRHADDNTPLLAPPRYIHCAIGDTLALGEIQHEEREAERFKHLLSEKLSSAQEHNGAPFAFPQDGPRDDEAPIGFDRLLQSGFTPSDIAALRNSFMSHLSNTHTPDMMPSNEQLRRLEEQWLDTDAQGPQDISAEGDSAESNEGTALDDIFLGNIWGFFWPTGALVWGFREDGVWTRRRKIAVFTALMVNLVFGFARMTSSR